jgi:hypothetical protein
MNASTATVIEQNDTLPLGAGPDAGAKTRRIVKPENAAAGVTDEHVKRQIELCANLPDIAQVKMLVDGYSATIEKAAADGGDFAKNLASVFTAISKGLGYALMPVIFETRRVNGVAMYRNREACYRRVPGEDAPVEFYKVVVNSALFQDTDWAEDSDKHRKLFNALVHCAIHAAEDVFAVRIFKGRKTDCNFHSNRFIGLAGNAGLRVSGAGRELSTECDWKAQDGRLEAIFQACRSRLAALDGYVFSKGSPDGKAKAMPGMRELPPPPPYRYKCGCGAAFVWPARSGKPHPEAVKCHACGEAMALKPRKNG